MNPTIQPIILCGGYGLRMWPLSTKAKPKQFISLGEKGTLLEETLRRVSLVTHECSNKGYHIFEPLLVMHIDHNLPPELASHKNSIVYEHFANDTAVAVARAATEIKNRHGSNNVIMLVLPADHYIENVDAFVYDIVEGITHIDPENIVLYGIEPTAPETKYGYIIPAATGVWFKEKPDATTALELIKQKALWNSGIFAAHVDLVFKCLRGSQYSIMDWVYSPREGKAPSFDVAVLQEHKNIFAHYCLRWRWSDVGTWESFTAIPEVKGEINQPSTIIMSECSNVNVLNRGLGNVVIIGCKDLLVVSSGTDLLIMPSKGDFNNQLKEIATRLGK
ncbi:Nucleotidyl transferase [uncultured virus]|nr:Nucleotidyl transferase [uncultured virus]